jgi:ABC-2 type transport system permease protein
MNVFWRELRTYRKSVLLWSAGIVLLLVASMAKFNTLTAGGMDVNQLLDQFPATVQAVFGMNGLDITTIVGYFGVLYLYVAVMLAIQAGMMGADMIDKEEQDKTTEFLYVKPRSRARILTAKLCAALVVLVVLNIVTFATSRKLGQHRC